MCDWQDNRQRVGRPPLCDKPPTPDTVSFLVDKSEIDLAVVYQGKRFPGMLTKRAWLESQNLEVI